jgi:hypothetical protein
VQSTLGHDTAVIHKAFHGLHGASLSAEVVEIRITALRLVPWQEGEALSGLTFLETGNLAQYQHPPVVGLKLFAAANVACERDIPNHRLPHPVKDFILLFFPVVNCREKERLPTKQECQISRR